MERLVFIHFNPWKQKYKTPFGATLINNFVTLSIEVIAEEIQRVTLVIHKDFEETQRIKMEKTASHFYTYEYFLNRGKGLYFYHFEVVIQVNGESKTFFYGASPTGGKGQSYESIESIWDFQLTCFEQEEKTPTWYREGIFYQIFPDRFYNGNETGLVNQPKKNSFIYGTTADDPLYIKNEIGEILRWDFFGGNLKGIKAKIPYLKELGITGIYLNPIFEAASNHRYDTADFLKIDPVLGSEEEFKELLDTLHENGLRLILDGVFSHVGQNSRYFNKDGRYGWDVGAYRNVRSPYFSWFQFINYPDNYQSWWGIADLPTIDKNNYAYQSFIYGKTKSVLTKWNALGVDGWRLDVADELPATFIRGIRENLESYPEKVLIGEVWEDASNKISYQKRRDYILGDQLQGVMNYPLRNGMIALLTNQQTPEQVAKALIRLYENYPRDVFFNNFNNLGTHDTERILTVLDSQLNKLDLALGMFFVFAGVPCIYYGDEVGLTGGKDPGNRKFYPWQRENQAVLMLFKKWLSIRKEHSVLLSGDLSLFYTDHLFGVLRKKEEDYVALLLNPTSQSCEITTSFVFLAEESSIISEIEGRLMGQTLAENSYLLIHS